jgi:hypothetical protein
MLPLLTEPAREPKARDYMPDRKMSSQQVTKLSIYGEMKSTKGIL